MAAKPIHKTTKPSPQLTEEDLSQTEDAVLRTRPANKDIDDPEGEDDSGDESDDLSVREIALEFMVASIAAQGGPMDPTVRGRTKEQAQQAAREWLESCSNLAKIAHQKLQTL